MQQSPGDQEDNGGYETGTQLMQTAQSSCDLLPQSSTAAPQNNENEQEELRILRDENWRLKMELNENAVLLEERTRIKDNETVEILQKYQVAV